MNLNYIGLKNQMRDNWNASFVEFIEENVKENSKNKGCPFALMIMVAL